MHEDLKGFHEFLIATGYSEVGRNKGGIKYAGSKDLPILCKLDDMGFEQDEETLEWQHEDGFAVMVTDTHVYCSSDFLPDDFVDEPGLKDILSLRMNELSEKPNNG